MRYRSHTTTKKDTTTTEAHLSLCVTGSIWWPRAEREGYGKQRSAVTSGRRA